MENDEIIASCIVTAHPAEGPAFELVIELTKLYRDSNGNWRCRPTMRPLWNRLAASSGIDSLQALCLSLALINDLVDDFIAKGGQLSMDGERFMFEGYPMATFAGRADND